LWLLSHTRHDEHRRPLVLACILHQSWHISVQEGQRAASIKMTLDDEITIKHEFIGRKENGMPEPMGEKTEVKGANFEVWKEDEGIAMDDALRSSIKQLCAAFEQALSRYYAFGHVFSEEI
jgi:hypothetical protein